MISSIMIIVVSRRTVVYNYDSDAFYVAKISNPSLAATVSSDSSQRQ